MSSKLKPRVSYSVKRTGTFHAKPKGGTHCGTGQDIFTYTCEVIAKTLDARGFVIDNLDIQVLVEELVDDGMFLSCELFCERLCRVILKKMNDENPESLSAIIAEVSPLNLPSRALCKMEF